MRIETRPLFNATLLPSLAAASILCAACDSGKVPEPSPKADRPTADNAAAAQAASAAKPTPSPAPTPPPEPAKPAVKIPARPVAEVPVAPDDPIKGKWTLDDAVKGLQGEGDLYAVIDTAKGKLDCELWTDKAPLTVANFVGLARGLRPWKHPDGKWVTTPLYDGTTFHRIIKGFMIQGGDPKGNGTGEPGYVIPDEIWENGSHDERGLLCMANRGPNTNGAQFFILDAAATYLDGKYTIFGKCSPGEVIEALASEKTRGDRAIDPPKIKKVSIEKRAPK